MAAGAGAVGWGLASVNGQGDAKGFFGGKSASRYATLPEMEEVSLLPTQPMQQIFDTIQGDPED